MIPFQSNESNDEDSYNNYLTSDYTSRPNNASFHQMTNISPLTHDDWQWQTTYAALPTETEMLNQLVSMAGSSLHVPTPGSSSSSSSIEPNRLHQREWNYELIVAQQPVRARMCGFGDKDRRPVNPPPIVELVITTKDGNRLDPDQVDVTHFIAHCDSWQADGITQANIIVPTDPTKRLELQKTRNLVGNQVSTPLKLYNVDGRLGIFFIFSDVSIRLEGRYRLGFSLIDIRIPPQAVFPTSQIIAKVYSDVITVYSGKTFPGVVSRTPLSVCFLKQGVKIPVRKEDHQDIVASSNSSGTRHSCSK
ncbi:velvet factor-domain-containing protein [Dichotomocladium elegans]|nr:velvet factor-domain-containing protein [Dichotomocladium elegans]